jgi:hypothetical protein
MGGAAFRVVRNLESMTKYQISNCLFGMDKYLAGDGEDGYKKIGTCSATE